MTPTEPGRAELMAELRKWSSVYPTWGDSGPEQRCRMAVRQMESDAAQIQALAARVAALEAAGAALLAAHQTRYSTIDGMPMPPYIEPQATAIREAAAALRAALREEGAT